jgi:sulfoxide reductase heme-binding subunit YedZ
VTRERKLLLGAAIVAGAVAAAATASASAGHALARATGGTALALLLASLATSPIAPWATPPWAVALRSVRRTLGITAALVAVLHSCFALPAYLDPLVLGPVLALPWLRHGAIALGVLLPLAVTSFPALQRALRVRAWSALHRLVYLAAILASLHALAVPFGSTWLGLVACIVTGILLLARPLALFAKRRPSPAHDE